MSELKEIVKELENNLSPKVFNYDSIYGVHYKPLSKRKIVGKIMVTLDLSEEAIDFALQKKVSLIISRYGLIHRPITRIDQRLIKKIAKLRNQIVFIFVLGSSFIVADDGVLDKIMDLLFIQSDESFNIKPKNKSVEIPIGKYGTPKYFPNQKEPFLLLELLNRIKNNFNVNPVTYVGNPDKIIERLFVIGIPLGVDIINKALKYKNFDCWISGKISNNLAHFAKDNNVSGVEIPIYKAETEALKELHKSLSQEFYEAKFYLYESKDPISYYTEEEQIVKE